MPTTPAFRARFHAALNRALDDCTGPVTWKIEIDNHDDFAGSAHFEPDAFVLRVPAQGLDEGEIRAAMDVVVRLGPDGKPLVHGWGQDGEGRAACGYDSSFAVLTNQRGSVTCPECRAEMQVPPPCHFEILPGLGVCGAVTTETRATPHLRDADCPDCIAKAREIANALAVRCMGAPEPEVLGGPGSLVDIDDEGAAVDPKTTTRGGEPS